MLRTTSRPHLWVAAVLLIFRFTSCESTSSVARGAKKYRDLGACNVSAPSRLRAGTRRREMLWGGDSPQHPELAEFLERQGWPDVQVRVPGEGDGAGDGKWIEPARAALTQIGFAITTPVVSSDVADRLRAYVFRLAHEYSGYRSPEGCVGILNKCTERFDMPLRFSPEVAAAANQFVAAMHPVLAAELGTDAELVEMAAIMTCAGSPAQDAHVDSNVEAPSRDDRLISSLMALQDTTARHGPTELFFPKNLAALPPRYERYVFRSARSKVLYYRVPWEPGKKRLFGVTGTVRQGCAVMYDSRALHRASMNAKGSRIMFLMSFRNRGGIINGPTYTISPKYVNVSYVEVPDTGAPQNVLAGLITLADFPVKPDLESGDFGFAKDDTLETER